RGRSVTGRGSRQQQGWVGGFAQIDIGEGAATNPNRQSTAHRQQCLEQGKTLDPTAGVSYASINQISQRSISSMSLLRRWQEQHTPGKELNPALLSRECGGQGTS